MCHGRNLLYPLWTRVLRDYPWIQSRPVSPARGCCTRKWLCLERRWAFCFQTDFQLAQGAKSFGVTGMVFASIPSQPRQSNPIKLDHPSVAPAGQRTESSEFRHPYWWSSNKEVSRAPYPEVLPTPPAFSRRVKQKFDHTQGPRHVPNIALHFRTSTQYSWTHLHSKCVFRGRG